MSIWSATPIVAPKLSGDGQVVSGGTLTIDSGGTLTIAAGATFTLPDLSIGLGKLTITGTPSSSTFLRGDGAWVIAPGTGTVTAVTGSGPIASTGGVTPAISIAQSTASTAGYLSSADWTAFNAKLSFVTADAPLTGTGISIAHLTIPQASGSVAGYLASADWSLFNSKQSTALSAGHIRVGNASNVATDLQMTGNVTINSGGVTTIGAGQVTTTMMANAPAYSFVGNATSGTAAHTDMTAAQAAAALAPAAVVQTTRVYCMGDSLSYGTFEPTLLSLLGGSAAGWDVVSRGVPGNTLTRMAVRFPFEVAAPGDAKYIVIWGGINDITADISAATVEASLQALYTAAAATGAQVIACTITPFNGNASYTSGRETVRTTVNAWILSASPTGVNYKADLSTNLQDPADHTYLLAANASADDLHHSTIGFALDAATIFAAVTWTRASTTYSISASAKSSTINQDVSTSGTPIFLGVTLGPGNAYRAPLSIPLGVAVATPASGQIQNDGTLLSYTQSTNTVRTLALGGDLANVTNDAQVKRTEMGAASGVATLDASSKVIQHIPGLNVDGGGTLDASGNTTPSEIAPLIVTRGTRDYLFFDGQTANGRPYWTLGTPGTGIGAGNNTIRWLGVVPEFNAAANFGLWLLCSSNATYSSTSAWAYSARINSSGTLIIAICDPTGANYRQLALTGFRALYSGRWTALHVTWNGTSAPLVYINSVLQTMTETTGGTPPAWTQAVDDAFFSLGIFAAADLFYGRVIPCAPINGVLTQADITCEVQTGKLPPWAELGTGSMVASYTPAWGTDADSFTGVRGTIAGNIDAISDGTISKNDCLFYYADATASTSHYARRAPIASKLVYGQRYRCSGWVYIPTGQTHVNGVLICNNMAGNDSVRYGGVAVSTTGAWTAFSYEMTAFGNGGFVWIAYATVNGSPTLTGANSSTDDRFYLYGMTFTPIGPLFRPIVQPVLVVADTGANKIAGVLVAGVSPVTDRRDWIIQWNTTTSGNQQLCGASVFVDYTKILLDDWCVNNAGTSKTISLGSASAGTQYLNGGTAAAGRNKVTLVTPLAASAALWCNSNGTDALQHTVRGHLVD